MPSSAPQHSNKNVIDIFTRKPLSELDDNPIIRIAAELDGLEILYSNADDQDTGALTSGTSTSSIADDQDTSTSSVMDRIKDFVPYFGNNETESEEL